jgi:HSP20 family molecular chaperone IbpA
MNILVHRPHESMTEFLRWLEEPLLALRSAGGHPMRAEEQLTDMQYVLRAEIPGVDPVRDIEIALGHGIVTITARRQPESGDPRRSEFRYGTLSRSFRLPSQVDEDAIRASYGHGILEITTELGRDRGHGPRRIPVRASQHVEPA